MDLIQTYFHDVLIPQLRPFGIGPTQRAELLSDLERRFMKTVGARASADEWSALIEPCREEALRYQPEDADDDIRLLVNAFLRNSLFEDLCCDHPSSPLFQGSRGQIIPDNRVREFTSKAIVFFQEHRSKLLDGDPPMSFELASRFPLAHRAFWEVSQIDGGERTYLPPQALPRPQPTGMKRPVQKSFQAEIGSGFDPTISQDLWNQIHWSGKDKSMFFTPNFKFLSRNVEKVFQVVDIVLSNGSAFVTLNYGLTNGHVTKRRGLLPVGHDSDDYRKQLSDETGLSLRHKKYLHRLISKQ